jgi:hypothetical protein
VAFVWLLPLHGRNELASSSSPLYHPRYPMDVWQGGPQSRSGRCGEQKEEKIRFPLPGIESPSLSNPARSTVTIMTELSPMKVKVP